MLAISCFIMKDVYPLYLAGRPVAAQRTMIVTDKYSGKPAAKVSLADRAMIQSAISAAAETFPAMRTLASHKRQAILQHVVNRLGERQEEFARMMVVEAGKPIRDARGEVGRAIETFRIAAEESVRIVGEWLPLDISQRAEGYQAVTRRFPVGPCSFITPFNFPLNLVAHKIAPAIACGCPFVLKPAPQTPITAILLGEILAETDLPAGSWSIVPCEVDDAAPLIEDDRIKLLSFTGSAAVGWMLKSKAGKKKVVLELGGNAACIVDRDVDIDRAVARITYGAFYQSGQSCISVQRLLIHSSLYESVKSKLVDAAKKLKSGDPSDESTFLGPLISEKDAMRVEQWIGEAVKAGARTLCGGSRRGAFFDATIVEGVPSTAKLSCEEAFGPVMTIESFTDFADAVAKANSSRYGLQAGVFTNDLGRAMFAFENLEVGGVIINDVPSMRVDSMPYGGVKDSGLGREGVRYAIEEMTEIRAMVTKRA